jgi:hypothetical protein
MNDLKKTDILYNAFIACGAHPEKISCGGKIYIIAHGIVHIFDHHDRYEKALVKYTKPNQIIETIEVG